METRISRCNYGIIYDDFFDANKHFQSERYVHGVTGEVMARDQLKWYLERVCMSLAHMKYCLS